DPPPPASAPRRRPDQPAARPHADATPTPAGGPVAGRYRDENLPGLPAVLHRDGPLDLLRLAVPQDGVSSPPPAAPRRHHRPSRPATTRVHHLRVSELPGTSPR